MADRDDDIQDPLDPDAPEAGTGDPSAGTAPENAPAGPPDADLAEAAPAQKPLPALAARYGRMRWVGEFVCPPNLRLTPGRKMILSTDRGIEVGEPIELTRPDRPGCVAREQILAYAQASGGDACRLRNGRVLREATESDLVELEHIERGCAEKLDTCARFAIELGLKMKVIACEHLFGGERIVFYFMADERVDFRELVRKLAGEYQTRIEMRQVGARDEARLLADYETCGRECCCRGMLKTLKPVSMHMAKMQKATLDPAKVSGRCGRLKCCLRFEHETYETLVKRMPRMGSRVAWREGVGKVVDRQLLTQLVRVLDDGGRLVTVPVEEITERDLPPPPPPGAGGADDAPPNRRGPRGAAAGPPRPRSPEPARPARGPRTQVDAGTNEAAIRPEAPPQSDESPVAAGDASNGKVPPPDGAGDARPRAPGMPPDRRAPRPGTHARRRRGRRRGRGRGPGHPGASS